MWFSFCHKSLEDMCTSNSRQWWSTIKRLLFLGSNDCALLNLANTECEGELSQLAEIVNTNFAKVSQDLDPFLQKDQTMSHFHQSLRGHHNRGGCVERSRQHQSSKGYRTRPDPQLGFERYGFLPERTNLCYPQNRQFPIWGSQRWFQNSCPIEYSATNLQSCG